MQRDFAGYSISMPLFSVGAGISEGTVVAFGRERPTDRI